MDGWPLPATPGVETDIPVERKIDGVAEVTLKSLLSPLQGRKQTQLAFKDERAVDAAWTSTRTGPKPVAINDSRRRRRRSRHRVGPVDDARRRCRPTRRRKALISRNFSEPSDGLEPSTPSLPSRSRATQFLLQIGLLQAD
jgi:hypothetical protein